MTGSRPESRMEVDEAPRSKGRFNLDRAAQEHMNEGFEVWIPSESASSLRGLETKAIRPLMDVALPGYTPSSTPGSSQVSGSSSRLKELHERLQLRNRESPTRVDLPSTWGEQPVRNVVISSYKKNTEGRYHRHNRMGLGGILHAATCARRSGPPDHRGQLVAGADPDPVPLANGDLELRWSRDAADVSDT